MKNKWLWITLSVVLVLALLVGTAFVFLRIGLMRRISTVATSSEIMTDNCVQVTVSEDGKIVKGSCEMLEDSEGQTLEAIPDRALGFRGMMGQDFDRFDRLSYNPRYNMIGSSRISMFSPLRWLGGLVLLAVLVLLVILIVKALTGKTRLVIKTQPEVVEVPPVDTTEQK